METTPSLIFMTGQMFTSSDTVLEVNETFKVGVLASKDPSSSANIALFKVTREFNDTIEVVHEDNDVGEPNLSWESVEEANSAFGEEKWTFAITDSAGTIKEISFIITTLTQGALSPGVGFIVGSDYVSEDVTLPVESKFKVGFTAFRNAETGKNLQNFKITRTFNNTTTTVFEEDDINEAIYMWEDTLVANSSVGNESWAFIVIDQAGRTNEISFVVTTEAGQPYIPVFSPTYLIVNQGGTEYLDFYITCVTDDWEMTKIVVSYPGGLGSETYVGSGQIITAGSPFTFSNYFVKLTGTWTFTITGNIKSGVHVNESFTAICTLTLSGK